MFSEILPSRFLQTPYRVGVSLNQYVFLQEHSAIQIVLLKRATFTMKPSNLEQRVCLS